MRKRDCARNQDILGYPISDLPEDTGRTLMGYAHLITMRCAYSRAELKCSVWRAHG